MEGRNERLVCALNVSLCCYNNIAFFAGLRELVVTNSLARRGTFVL